MRICINELKEVRPNTILTMIKKGNLNAYLGLQQAAIEKGYEIEEGKMTKFSPNGAFPSLVINLCSKHAIIPTQEFLCAMAEGTVHFFDHYKPTSFAPYAGLSILGCYTTDDCMTYLMKNANSILICANDQKKPEERKRWEQFALDWSEAFLSEYVKTKSWNSLFLPAEGQAHNKRKRNEHYHCSYLFPYVMNEFRSLASSECWGQFMKMAVKIVGSKNLKKTIEGRLAMERSFDKPPNEEWLSRLEKLDDEVARFVKKTGASHPKKHFLEVVGKSDGKTRN